MRYTPFLLTLISFTLSACVPANTPNELAALASVRQTQETGAYATQVAALPITQSAQESVYRASLTETFIPPALTATANANDATHITNVQSASFATRISFYATHEYSATLRAGIVVESDYQRRIAENNSSIANATNGANTMRDVLTWGGWIIIVGFGISIAWGVIQLGLYTHNTRKARETSDKWKRVFEAERLMLAAGVAQTSAGPTSYTPTSTAVTLAEKHLTTHTARLDQWRAAGKRYVIACVNLQRSGVSFPYSRANACKHLLITHPDKGGWWQLGHDRIIKMLTAMEVLGSSGQGGEVKLIVDLDSVSRVIDLSPYSDWPPDPIPSVKITLAGLQVSQVLAGTQVSK